MVLQSKGLVRLFSQTPTYLLKPCSEIPSSRKPSLTFPETAPSVLGIALTL